MRAVNQKPSRGKYASFLANQARKKESNQVQREFNEKGLVKTPFQWRRIRYPPLILQISHTCLGYQLHASNTGAKLQSVY